MNFPIKIRNRAYTRGAKRAVIERLYTAWCSVNDLTLSQLLEDATGDEAFYLEDFELVEVVEDFVRETTAR